MKKSTIFLLATFAVAALGFFTKINGHKIVGDISLLASAILFYTFLYFTLRRRRTA